MCFDKTGTLTDDTIEFAGVVPSREGHFETMLTDVRSIDGDPIVKSMAACHSLVEYEGKVEGDDLDLKLLAATGWKFVGNYASAGHSFQMETPDERVLSSASGHETMIILKQFPFESFLQRMLVIARDVHTTRHLAIVKGAPEIVASFCSSETLPKHFLETFESFTRKGFRVLATATKVIPDSEENCRALSRTEIECQMTFVGLYLFKNKLKDATYDVLQELRRANIRCIMVTGDNLLTGISVAEECHLVDPSAGIIKVQARLDKCKKLSVNYSYVKYPQFVIQNDPNANFELGDDAGQLNFHLAMDGDSFSALRAADPSLLERVIRKGAIFARMIPDQKLILVNMLQKQSHSVGMCGDGEGDRPICYELIITSIIAPSLPRCQRLRCLASR